MTGPAIPAIYALLAEDAFILFISDHFTSGCGLTLDDCGGIMGWWWPFGTLLLWGCCCWWDIGPCCDVGISDGCCDGGGDACGGCCWGWGVTEPGLPPPIPLCPVPGFCFMIFLYFDRLFWNQIFTWKYTRKTTVETGKVYNICTKRLNLILDISREK